MCLPTSWIRQLILGTLTGLEGVHFILFMPFFSGEGVGGVRGVGGEERKKRLNWGPGACWQVLYHLSHSLFFALVFFQIGS
jgi:hypothetical protein